MVGSYVLHNRLGSGGFVVEATLALAGLEFLYEPIKSIPNTSVKPLVEHINPWGQVPILETPDGKLLTEVAAILAYLARQEPACRSGPHLFDPDPASFLRWSVFLSVNVYEGVLRQCYPHRFFESAISSSCEGGEGGGGGDAGQQQSDYDTNNTTIEAGSTSNMMRLRLTDQMIARSIQKSAKKRTHEAFLLLEEHVIEEGAFLLGPKLSACDIYLAMLYAWHNKQPDLPKCTEITRRVATHELIRPIWERNFHDRLDEKWHER